VVVAGERLDHLAARFYGDPRRYWLILDANPEILDPFDLLVPGRRIRIPRDRTAGE
jgi:nucleoid-associated protein YgaU